MIAYYKAYILEDRKPSSFNHQNYLSSQLHNLLTLESTIILQLVRSHHATMLWASVKNLTRMCAQGYEAHPRSTKRLGSRVKLYSSNSIFIRLCSAQVVYSLKSTDVSNGQHCTFVSIPESESSRNMAPRCIPRKLLRQHPMWTQERVALRQTNLWSLVVCMGRQC